MHKIYKWTLIVTDRQTLQLPKNAAILTVQMQGERPQLWARIDTDAELETRVIHIYGTGHSMPKDAGQYIATFQCHEGSLVFHVFDATATDSK